MNFYMIFIEGEGRNVTNDMLHNGMDMLVLKGDIQNIDYDIPDIVSDINNIEADILDI